MFRLAERIAAYVLAHPRVVRVTVRVEKLDIGPGGVGVEIVRERPAEAATVHQHRDAAEGRLTGNAAFGSGEPTLPSRRAR